MNISILHGAHIFKGIYICLAHVLVINYSEYDTPNTQDFRAKIAKTFAQKPHEANKDNDSTLHYLGFQLG